MAAARDAAHAKPRPAAGEPAGGGEARPKPEPKAAVESGAPEEGRREQGDGASRRRRGRRRGRGERKPEQAGAALPADIETDEAALDAAEPEPAPAAEVESPADEGPEIRNAHAEAAELPAPPPESAPEPRTVEEAHEPAKVATVAPEAAPPEATPSPLAEEEAGTLAEAEVEAETAPGEIRVEAAEPAAPVARPGWAPAETIRVAASAGGELIQIETDPSKVQTLVDVTEEAPPRPRSPRAHRQPPVDEGPLVQVETRKL